MDPNIKARFQDAHLDEIVRRYGVDPGSLELLDGFESFIYQFRRGGEGYVLRIGHSARRSPAQIHAEVDWINYLAAGMGLENGIPAAPARAVHSREGRLVEAVADGHGEQFLATAFTHAPGQHYRRETLTEQLIENYGRMLGRIHALSRRYQPADPSWTRPQWDDPENIAVEQYLPPGSEPIAAHFNQTLARLGQLPRSPETYGMIHQDAHGGNFFVDDGGFITLFDFDDCCYGPYIYDIAMVLFYAAVNEDDPAAFTRWFMPTFLRGYQREFTLDPDLLLEIPHFLKLREIDLYALIHRSFDVENIDHPWTLRYLRGRKERLTAGVPFIDFDFAELRSTSSA
jgi:amicoumacin kinase